MDRDVCCPYGEPGCRCSEEAGDGVAPQPKGQAILMDSRDNVATALQDLPQGTTVEVGGQKLLLLDPIPFGHKFALVEVPSGHPVVKYGEVIGLAKRLIATGQHVHRHNLDHQVEAIIMKMRESI